MKLKRSTLLQVSVSNKKLIRHQCVVGGSGGGLGRDGGVKGGVEGSGGVCGGTGGTGGSRG